MLTIVMYHYVRDLARSRFPQVKGLDLARFRGQVEHLCRHHTVVTMERTIAAAHGGQPLPADAALLTFDDGYADHCQTVFPILDEHGIQGSFFPPSAAVMDGRVLDVNKVHHVLASVPDPRPLVAAVLAMAGEFRDSYPIEPAEAYLARYAHPNRFDPAEVIFVKRMLQVGLPGPVRRAVTDALFRRHVTAGGRAFAAELYVTLDQLRFMRRHGMFVGSHTHDHDWLDSVGPADVGGDSLLLSRFDTNDLPMAA